MAVTTSRDFAERRSKSVLLYCEKRPFSADNGPAGAFDTFSPEGANTLLRTLNPEVESKLDDDQRTMFRAHVQCPPYLGFREGGWYEFDLRALKSQFDVRLEPNSTEETSSLLFRGTLQQKTDVPLDATKFRVASPPTEATEEETAAKWPRYPWGSATAITVVGCGQGNWNEVTFNHSTLIYDTGADQHWGGDAVRKFVAGRHLARSHRLDVVISHWDVDHYHALLAMAPADLGAIRTFTAPGPTPNNATSKRVLAMLRDANVKLFLVQAARRPSGERRIVLVDQGQHGAIHRFRAVGGASRNQTGIVLVASGKTRHAVLTGDHHHHKVFEALDPLGLKNVVLVVPHHGGRAGRHVPNDWTTMAPLDTAFSFGCKNPYGHPFPQTVQNVGRSSCSVFFTCGVNTQSYRL